MSAFANLYPEALMPDSGLFCLDRDEWAALGLGMAVIARRAAEIAPIGPVIAAVARDAERLAVAWQHELRPLGVQLAQQLHAFGAATAVRYVKIDSGLADLACDGPASLRQRLRQTIRAVYDHSRDCLAVANQLNHATAAYAAQARDLHRRLRSLAEGYERASAINGGEVSSLHVAIERAQRMVAEHQARYNECVAAAATSVTYAWIPIVGLVAGDSLAGAGSERAPEAKRRLDEATATLAALRAQLSLELDETYRLGLASAGSRDLATAFDAQQPLLDRISGAWDALAGDLAALEAALDGDLGQGRAHALQAALRDAARGWSLVAAEAAAYCAHDGPEIVAPRFFGQYVTRIGSAGGFKNHELVISERGVSVAGVAVCNPIFSTDGLRFAAQSDARRDAKPIEAVITFTADGFQGVCRFPDEPPTDWSGCKAA